MGVGLDEPVEHGVDAERRQPVELAGPEPEPDAAVQPGDRATVVHERQGAPRM
ncbi:MAG: hypothetical protein R2726_14000 [Acidimicrobiales bacterium]